MAEIQNLPGACKDFEPDLVLFYYQDLAGVERQRVESHLESCAPCRTFLAGLRDFLPATVQADEPSPAFWQGYSREMRAKLDAAAEEKTGWRQTFAFLFRPWPIPAMATALILVLALTFSKGWLPTPTVNEPELGEMTENVDFLNSMDFLDSMALLEAVEGEAQNGETTSRSL